MRRKTVLERLMNIDRRYIFLLIAFSVIIPMLLKVVFPIFVTTQPKKVYDYIENLPKGSVVMMSFDYGPGSLAELQPMAIAVLKHCFSRNLKVIGMALWNVGAPLGEAVFDQVAKEYERVYGEDYVFLGFRPGSTSVILRMGEGISGVFDKDSKNSPIQEIPMMKNIKTYDDIVLIIDFGAGDPGPETWVIYTQKYSPKIAAGVTGVIISQLYPFLQTGQLIGLIGGLRGAAEYETQVDKPAEATQWMSIQSIVHLIIIILVILGNVAYFVIRRRETVA
jgi:hypothetical protein